MCATCVRLGSVANFKSRMELFFFNYWWQRSRRNSWLMISDYHHTYVQTQWSHKIRHQPLSLKKISWSNKDQSHKIKKMQWLIDWQCSYVNWLSYFTYRELKILMESRYERKLLHRQKLFDEDNVTLKCQHLIGLVARPYLNTIIIKANLKI